MSNFRNGRSLTARSVLLSVLLGTDPPRLPVRLLVSTTALFGITENTARTALSRMAAAGEVRADDGWYEIVAPRLIERRASQEVGRRGARGTWDGSWLCVVIAADGSRPADERASLRSDLTGARLAELREGVWLRPDNIPRIELPPRDELVVLRSRPDDDPEKLARRLWDLDAWSLHSQELRRRLGELIGPLEAGDRGVLTDGFVLSAEVLRHLRTDPLLPPALVNREWPGDDLRVDYEQYDRAYRQVLRSWFDLHRP